MIHLRKQVRVVTAAVKQGYQVEAIRRIHAHDPGGAAAFAHVGRHGVERGAAIVTLGHDVHPVTQHGCPGRFECPPCPLAHRGVFCGKGGNERQPVIHEA